MNTCQECGNHDMHAKRLDGATVHECGLCGAQFGDRGAVENLERCDEATRRGVDPRIWPLGRVLEGLPGVELGAMSAGGEGGQRDASGLQLPFVELVVIGAEALLSMENLAKTLRLAMGSLLCTWRIEARFELALVFQLTIALRDQHRLRDAYIDVEALAKQLERNQRLQWWRRTPHAPDAGSR
ncbi:MAG: hypothetical protein AB8H80_19845 [Planctomycetota bacterium]